MTKDQATKLFQVYADAWIARDPDLITAIFTDDATYADPREPLCVVQF